MKLNLFIAAVFFFLIAANAQKSINTYKILNVTFCDTCTAPVTYNGGKIINYMIIGARVENESENEEFNKTNNNNLPNVSKYLIASGIFTLDFVADDLIRAGLFQISDQTKMLAKKKLKATPLQFSVLLNNEMIKGWTDIFSLGADKQYQSFESISDGDTVKRSVSFTNYHAGDFELSINDSLVVLIRNTATKKTVESILIKRKPYYPQAFDFIKFSSDSARRAYDDNNVRALLNLSKKFYSPTQIHKDSIDHFEMEPEETAIIQFEDLGIKHGLLQFAFAGDDTFWRPFAINADPEQNFSGIAIEKPTPGKTMELMVRYTHQPERIHHIFIKVHGRLTSTTWFKVAMTFLTAALLFAILYIFKRRRHKAQLRKLTRNKEEIESKLQLLSGQLNPHFLFNSLNSVQNLINKNDTENANLYVSEVSSFLRTIMDAGKKEYISLEEELGMEEAYIKLEQKRKAFNYNIINNCSSNLSQIEFPPSLLQPIIENSIHHGFSRDIGNPLITICIACNEKQLIVSVADNGQGFDEALIIPGHGLALVQKRILLMNEKLNGMPIELKVEPTDKGTVTIFTFQNWL